MRLSLIFFFVSLLNLPKAQSTPIAGAAICVGPQIWTCALIAAVSYGVYVLSVDANHSVILFESENNIHKFKDAINESKVVEGPRGMEVYDGGRFSEAIDLYGNPLFPEDDERLRELRNWGDNKTTAEQSQEKASIERDPHQSILNVTAFKKQKPSEEVRFSSDLISQYDCIKIVMELLVMAGQDIYFTVKEYQRKFPELILETPVNGNTLLRLERDESKIRCDEVG